MKGKTSLGYCYFYLFLVCSLFHVERNKKRRFLIQKICISDLYLKILPVKLEHDIMK
jgi:hypothetical protein